MKVESKQRIAKPIAAFYLIAGLVVFVVMTLALSAIAEDVQNREPLTLVDLRFSNWLHTHPIRWITTALWIITSLHSSTMVCIVALPLGIYLWKRRERFWVVGLWLAVYGGWALNKILKLVFQRTRPHFSDTVQTLTTYSFPSGHTMAATVFYGTLLVFFVSRNKSWPARMLAAGVAITIILLVAFSRIYLGAHYLSDVLAAMAEGFAWVALSLTALAYFWKPRA